jgi:hypothetical protein
MDPRWLIALWEEWVPIVKRNCPSQEEGEENAMLDIFSGLEPHYRSLRETNIKEIGVLISSVRRLSCLTT